MSYTTPKENKHFIGLMSGTSLDGVDVVLVDFKDSKPKLLASYCHSIPKTLKNLLIQIIQPNWTGSLETIGSLNKQLGELFAEASLTFINKEGLDPNQISAIGSHGQTLWHQPNGEHPFSMQLGDASLIAEKTGITTIADFRSRDVSADGQGAPLAPAFHQAYLSHPNRNRVILNIGGIANITLLPAKNSGKAINGFDTGPGNGLLDAWITSNTNKSYDKNGSWAKSGIIIPKALELLLSYDYFKQPAPKSTGKEEFNLNWLQKNLGKDLNSHKAEDIQATLTELTAKSIADSIDTDYEELFICGGGVHNSFLVERLKFHLPSIKVASTEELGIHPDWVEAMAFAWLAKQTLEGKSSNLPEVTGAKGKRILGAIHQA